MSYEAIKNNRTRRIFTAKYKQNVVDLVARVEKSKSEIRRDLGLSESAVRRWIRLAEQSDKGSLIVHEAENEELKRAYSREPHLETGARNPGKSGCQDNGVAESFFAILKKELIYRRHLAKQAAAALAISDYVEVFYNRVRMHLCIDQRLNNAMVA